MTKETNNFRNTDAVEIAGFQDLRGSSSLKSAASGVTLYTGEYPQWRKQTVKLIRAQGGCLGTKSR